MLSFADIQTVKILACTLPIISSFLGQILLKNIFVYQKKSKYDGYSSLEPSDEIFEKFKVLSIFPRTLLMKEREYLEKTIQIPLSANKLKEGDI